jgi:hypothetical protein
VARAWGLPTREEADALQRQIRELRQELGQRAVRPEAPRAASRSKAAPRPKTGKPRPKRTARRGRR